MKPERFKTKEEAEVRVSELNAVGTSAYFLPRRLCPIINGLCRVNCICLSKATMTCPDISSYYVHPRYCTSPLITGYVHSENY